jgi:hypothetical protein
MSEMPKVGMRYSQAIRNGVRFAKGKDNNLANSVINQVRLGEGTRAANAFAKELRAKSRER